MSEAWLTPIRAYCERGDASFWAEPLNAISNAAFLVAAGAAAWRENQGIRYDRPAQALSALVAVVGIGSFLFHTFAARWSLLADVIPIAVFIYAYFFLAMRRFFAMRLRRAILVTLAFAAFNAGLGPALDAATGRSTEAVTNGSIGYAPAILALLGVAVGLLRAAEPARRRAGSSILAVAALFAVSLTFRTMDGAVCASLPVGTHFLWHLLNAGVLYGLIATAIRYRARPL